MGPRVLVAYDGSAAADAAIATAARLLEGATGRLLTVVDVPELPQAGEALGPAASTPDIEALSRALVDAGGELAARGVAAALEAGLALEPQAAPRAGTTWQTILASADAVAADVIVCGSRGQGGVARSLLGSTSTSVLHNATRPVLVVPAAPDSIEGPALIAYDGSEGARAAVDAAGRLLSGRPAVLVNVWYSSVRHTVSGRALAGAPVADLRAFSADYEQMFADAAGAVLDTGVALAREAGLDASGRAIESGSGAWRAIAEEAERSGAAVIITGSRGRGGLSSALLGSVSSGLVHNAEAPVLVVPPGD